MISLLNKFKVSIFLLLLVLELFSITWFFDNLNPYLNPLIWIVSGFGSSILGYKLIQEEKRNSKRSTDKSLQLVGFAVLFIGLILIGYKIYQQTLQNPLDPLQSDIVPALQMYVQRFLEGSPVYSEMQFPSWTVFPNYFTMMWMPYVPAEVLHIDYRLFSYLLFSLTLIYLFYDSYKKEHSGLIPKAIFILVSLYFVTKFHTAIYIDAVEFTIASFYLLLCIGFGKRSILFHTVVILFILLSRYSFTFWLPVYFLIIWIQFGFIKVLKMGLLIAIGIVLIYLPFIWNDWTIFTKGMSYYSTVVASLWEPYYWQQAGEIPFHLKRGLSTSIYFHEFLQVNAMTKLKINQIVHLVLCLLTAFSVFIYYWRNRKSASFHLPGFLLCSLNVYFVIFFGFFYGPFSYLYLVPFVTKLPILLKVELR